VDAEDGGRPNWGGILADFPGAGKSVQATGLIVHSRNKWAEGGRQDAPKPTLIVYPASMADEWFLKIRKYAPTLRIFHYHGGSEQLTTSSRIFDGINPNNESTVVLASYEFWGAKHPGPPIRGTSNDEEFEVEDNRDQRGVLTGLFRRIICDDGHKLKGGSPLARARSVISLSPQYRHIHTATPMSNRVGDLVGLLEFLERPEFANGLVGGLNPYVDSGMELARVTVLSFKRHVLRHLGNANGKTFKLGVQRLRELLRMITLARTAHSSVPEAVGYAYSTGSNPSGLISEDIPGIEVKTLGVEFDAEEWVFWSTRAAPLWECLYGDVITIKSGTKLKRMNMAVHRKLSIMSTTPLLLAAITNTEPNWRAEGEREEDYQENANIQFPDESAIEYWIEVDFALVAKWRAEGRDLDFFLKKIADANEPLETPLDRLVLNPSIN
jgi:SNF2-related domain